MKRDKRHGFYTMPDLSQDEYLENERFINAIMKEKGILYAPPKVKLVKADGAQFHPFPCECHPKQVKKETICPPTSK